MPHQTVVDTDIFLLLPRNHVVTVSSSSYNTYIANNDVEKLLIKIIISII